MAVLPLLAFIALVNYHYYDFYQNNFQAIFSYLGTKPSLKTDQYNEIQQYHPFYDLYQEVARYRSKPVYYLYTRWNPKDKLAIDELFIRTAYFFYPRKIKPIHNLARFLNLNLATNSLVIADYDLRLTPLATRLRWLNAAESINRPQDYFFKKESLYYLYKVL